MRILLTFLFCFPLLAKAGSVYLDGQRQNINFKEFELAENGDLYLQSGGVSSPPPVVGQPSNCQTPASDVVLHDQLLKGTSFPPIFEGWGVARSQKWVLIPTGQIKTVAIKMETNAQTSTAIVDLLGQISGTTRQRFDLWVSQCPGGPKLPIATCSFDRAKNGGSLYMSVATALLPEKVKKYAGCELQKNSTYYLNIRRATSDEESGQCSTSTGKVCYTKMIVRFAQY